MLDVIYNCEIPTFRQRQVYAGFAPASLFVHPDGGLTAGHGKNALWTFSSEFLSEAVLAAAD